jgi:TatD DNase family protein
MQFVDTHCHIQFADYELDPEEVIASAKQSGVTQLMCVGCSLPDSEVAIEFAKRHDDIWAAIGLHPHEAARYVEDDKALQEFRNLAKQLEVKAIGETGLDYYYNNSPKEQQKELFRFQLSLAQEFNLPLIFHVRDAFDDFFAILDEFEPVRGVVHSFTADVATLEKILGKGLYIGLNGIMTFTKNDKQLEAAKAVPLNKLMLETDAPFLTPTPYRGTICEPKHTRVTAEFLASLRSESIEDLAKQTTENARTLFGI